MSHRYTQRNKMVHKRKVYEDREGDRVLLKMRKVDKGHRPQNSQDKAEMDEEAMLEKLVFGDASAMIENIDAESMDTEDSGVDEGTSGPDSDNGSTRFPVWQDDEDSCVKIPGKEEHKSLHPGPSSQQYSGYLKKQYYNIIGTPKWAELSDKKKNYDDSDCSDSENEILRSSGKFVSNQSLNLPRDILDFQDGKEMLCENVPGAVVATQFHPSATVALVAKDKGAVSLCQVDGKTNSQLQSILFGNFKINCARFTTDGEQFLVTSRQESHFFRYDMMEGRSLRIVPHFGARNVKLKKFQMSPDGRYMAATGNYGNIYLLTARTSECVGTLKMNGEVNAIAFNADGSRLFSHGDTGEVYVWDMASRTCLLKFVDDGCISGTALALSPNDQYIATGSQQGVVNIYDSSTLSSETRAPQPLKAIYNLTTSITSLLFNGSSEILAMASDEKSDAIKMVHCPSFTVFKNFPHFDTQKSRFLRGFDFSINSGYFAMASTKGQSLLFRLKHYGNY